MGKGPMGDEIPGFTADKSLHFADEQYYSVSGKGDLSWRVNPMQIFVPPNFWCNPPSQCISKCVRILGLPALQCLREWCGPRCFDE